MSSAQVTFLFADGVGKTEMAAPGELLSDVAERAGLHLLMDCREGKCGTCVAQLVSGAVEMDDYDPAVLPDSDRDDGAILTCVARACASSVVEFSYDSIEASADVAPPFTATVTACHQVAEEIWTLRVAVEAPLDFLPGQYVRLRPSPELPWRAYSMANAPGARELSFYVRIVPGGAFSSWLVERARPGDSIEVEGPFGAFFLRDEARPRLFVAGGSGLAPFLSMLKALGPAARAAPTTIFIGARSGDHLFAAEELRAATDTIPNLTIRRFVEREAPQDCETGYPTAGFASGPIEPGARVYVCGPPPMVEAARMAAESAGLNKQEMLFERFT